MLLPHVPLGVSSPAYYLCMGGAVLILALSKGGFGGGAGILAIPLMALVVGPANMLGIILPVLIVCDLFSNLHYIGQYDWSKLRGLIVGALVGVGVGSVILLILRGMPPAAFGQIMNLLIGGICLAVVAMQMWRIAGGEIPMLPSHPLAAATVGLTAGTVSTVNNSSGPILMVYLLHEKLPKRILVGTTLLYTLIINCAKVPTYTAMGFINLHTLRDSIWFIPLIPMGTLMGAWLNKRVSEKPFAAILYLAAAAAAGAMIYKAALG